ncbi:MAG: D-aminoacylase [Microbacterium sp.]
MPEMSPHPDAHTTIVRGALIIDGTGSAGYIGDVAFSDGVITAVGHVDRSPTAAIVDADGLVVAPGFVDIHSHSDLSILGHPQGTSKVLQGVTTEVVGNCGLAVAPVSSLDVAALMRPGMTYCEDTRVAWDWTSVAEYRQRVKEANPALSVEILAGHNVIRGSVIGLDERDATPAELEQMCDMLDQALTEGALGMSLGLMYPPSSYASEDELITLGRVLAGHDAMLASHMANYSEGLLESVASMIRVGEASGCRVQISHLTATGRPNWGSAVAALDLIDAAIARGVDVAADFYPYLAGSTNLSQVVPGWAMSGGLPALRGRLDDSETRQRIRAHLDGKAWEEFLIVSFPPEPGLEGQRLPDAAAQRGIEPTDLALQLLAVGDPTIIAFGRSEEDLLAVIAHHATVLGSDGLAVETNGTVGGSVPHPRFFGAFPALFEKYVREERVLSLEHAVYKCTAGPAERVRLRDRGRIAPGLRADLVLFDPDAIADSSTYEDSRQVPRGIHRVFRQGREIARDGLVLW